MSPLGVQSWKVCRGFLGDIRGKESCGDTGMGTLPDRSRVMTAEATAAQAGYPHSRERADRVAGLPDVCPRGRRVRVREEAFPGAVHPWRHRVSGPLCQLWRHLPEQLLAARGILPGLPQSCWGVTFAGKCTRNPGPFWSWKIFSTHLCSGPQTW